MLNVTGTFHVAKSNLALIVCVRTVTTFGVSSFSPILGELLLVSGGVFALKAQSIHRGSHSTDLASVRADDVPP